MHTLMVEYLGAPLLSVVLGGLGVAGGEHAQLLDERSGVGALQTALDVVRQGEDVGCVRVRQLVTNNQP